MVGKLKRLVSELMTPTNQEIAGPTSKAYRKLVGSVAHGVLGQAAMICLGWLGLAFWPAFLLVLGLYIAKEANDLRKGGDLADGIEDAASTLFAAFYHASGWLPLMILLNGVMIAMRYL